LTTKDQGVIFERTTETTTITPKGNSDRSRFIFLEIASYKRCSRPLCSSQTTTPYHTPHTRPTKGNNRVIGAARKPETNVPTPQPRTHPEREGQRGRAMVLLSQDPTVCQTLPNSPFRRAFQDTLKRASVLTAGLCRQAPIC
jgi:hypothetical protein